MNWEHIHNMDYSLRAVQTLFNLVKTKVTSLPDIITFHCEYDFLNPSAYRETIIEYLSEKKDDTLLKQHWKIAKSIVCEKSDTDKLTDFLYYLFSKSHSHPIHEVYKMEEPATDTSSARFSLIKTEWNNYNYPYQNFPDDFWTDSMFRKELYSRVDEVIKGLEFYLDDEETDNTQPTTITVSTSDKADKTAYQIPPEILLALEQNGFIALNPLKWLKSKALLGYFVEGMNDKYDLKHGEKRMIQPFETMFGKSGLSGAINDYKKTGNLPIGYKIIDNILK